MPSSVTVAAADAVGFGDVVFGGYPGMLQTAPKFPLAIAATKDLLSWANFFPSDTVPMLNASVTAVSQTIVLAADPGNQFPADNFEVSIDDEIVFVQQRSAGTLSGCIRGAENTSAASHAVNATVQLLVTALAHNQTVAELVALEQLLGANLQHVTPIEIPFTSTRGDFSVAHGLGTVPRRAGPIIMTSGGLVYFQPARVSATDVFMVASDDNLTGFVQVWI